MFYISDYLTKNTAALHPSRYRGQMNGATVNIFSIRSTLALSESE